MGTEPRAANLAIDSKPRGCDVVNGLYLKPRLERHCELQAVVRLPLQESRLSDMMEQHYASPRTTELSREHVVRLRIVTTQ